MQNLKVQTLLNKNHPNNIVVLHWATNTFFFLQISSIPESCHPGSSTQYHSFRTTALSWISIKITVYTDGTYWCHLVFVSMNRGSVLRQSLMITTTYAGAKWLVRCLENSGTEQSHQKNVFLYPSLESWVLDPTRYLVPWRADPYWPASTMGNVRSP